jgi:hypothetical protein
MKTILDHYDKIKLVEEAELRDAILSRFGKQTDVNLDTPIPVALNDFEPKHKYIKRLYVTEFGKILLYYGEEDSVLPIECVMYGELMKIIVEINKTKGF